MSGHSSNVRDVESLARLRTGLIRFAESSAEVLTELRAGVRRANEEFTTHRPTHWRSQVRLAERRLDEAREELARKRTAARASDRPAATEASIRVATAERRLRYCQEKERLARSLAIEVAHHGEKVLGPIADVTRRCDSDLPVAAAELLRLLESLRNYTDQPNPESKQEP